MVLLLLEHCLAEEKGEGSQATRMSTARRPMHLVSNLSAC